MSLKLAHPGVPWGCTGRGIPSSRCPEAAELRHPARIPHLLPEEQRPGEAGLGLLLTVSLWSILQAESDC